MGWTELVCSPLVLDLLWAKLTAGVELDVHSCGANPAQVPIEKRAREGGGGCSRVPITILARSLTTMMPFASQEHDGDDDSDDDDGGGGDVDDEDDDVVDGKERKRGVAKRWMALGPLDYGST